MSSPLPLIIINPHACQGRHAGLHLKIQAWLAEHHIHAQVVECETEQALVEVFTAQTTPTRVIGVGGDGTNHRILPYLLVGGHEYAVIPMGSGNDLARALGVADLTWQAALQVALTATATKMDIGQAEDNQGKHIRHFLGCFLLGLDGAISNETQAWKMRGPLPYLLTLVKKLPSLPSWRLALTIDDAQGKQETLPEQDMLLCSVLNTPTYGSGYPVAPTTKITDGALHLVCLPKVGRMRFLRLFVAMMQGKHLQQPEILYQAIHKVKVQSQQSLSLSADGEVIPWQSQSLTVRVLPQALSVVMSGGAAC